MQFNSRDASAPLWVEDFVAVERNDNFFRIIFKKVYLCTYCTCYIGRSSSLVKKMVRGDWMVIIEGKNSMKKKRIGRFLTKWISFLYSVKLDYVRTNFVVNWRCVGRKGDSPYTCQRRVFWTWKRGGTGWLLCWPSPRSHSPALSKLAWGCEEFQWPREISGSDHLRTGDMIPTNEIGIAEASEVLKKATVSGCCGSSERRVRNGLSGSGSTPFLLYGISNSHKTVSSLLDQLNFVSSDIALWSCVIHLIAVTNDNTWRIWLIFSIL